MLRTSLVLTLPMRPALTGLAMLPALVMSGGAALAVWRRPGAGLRSALLHFAAGVVFAVVAVELLPFVVRHPAPATVALGFSLGVAAMLGLRALTHRLGEPLEGLGPTTSGAAVGAPALPWGLLLAIGLDIFFDGLLLGIGFVAGAKAGLLLTLALTIELLSLGLAMALALRQQGQRRGRTIALVAGTSLLLPLGVGSGLLAFGTTNGPFFVGVLAFGLAALLFLVTEELLGEAHEEPDTPLRTLAFFAGFLLLLLLSFAA